METIDKGTLMITIDENNCKSVLFNPVNGTVWLTKCELVELFGIYTQTINACINTISNANIFRMDEVCKCHLIAKTGKNTIRYDPYKFSLEFIIAMAFRIDSENSKLLRKWFLDEIIHSKAILLRILVNKQNYEWN
jgi:Virulence protein